TAATGTGSIVRAITKSGWSRHLLDRHRQSNFCNGETLVENHNVNDVRPTSLNRMVGQTSVVNQVRVALDASHMDGQKFPNALMVGPPGVGKTQLCHIIAAEMA